MCLCLFTGDSLSVEGNSHPVFIGPTIESLSVYSGPIGTTVTIRGTGFTAKENKIVFGSLGTENNPNYSLPSFDSTITFVVPASNYVSCWDSYYSCKIPAIQTAPGGYQVSVINSNGQSNSVNFTVTGSSSATPSIRVISPNGGEVWKIGQTYPVTWTTNNAPTDSWVRLSYSIPSGVGNIPYTSNCFGGQIPASQGSYSWTISSSVFGCSDAGYIFSSNTSFSTKVKIELYTGAPMCEGLTTQDSPCLTGTRTLIAIDESDTNFTINSNTTSCPTGYVFSGSICIPTNSSITVTSPNSGFESIEQGGKVEIRWTSTVSIGAMVDVYVSDGVRKGNVLRTSNTGNVIYTLGDNLIPGSNYKAYVSLVSENPAIDSSDRPFTIKARSSIYPPGCTSYFGYSTTTGQPCGNSGNISKPVITFISQTSGPVGTNLVIRGNNFSSNTNKVMFGDYAFNLPASFYNSGNNEGSISFAVPRMLPNVACIQAPCYSSYIISIENSNGKSNETRFTITDGPVVDQGCLNGELYSTTTGQKCPIRDIDIKECNATKFTRALRYGSRNSQVDALQTILVDKGYLDESYATGLFSNRTRNAVKLLQSANGLKPDGSVGPLTRALLNNLWKTQCLADNNIN